MEDFPSAGPSATALPSVDPPQGPNFSQISPPRQDSVSTTSISSLRSMPSGYYRIPIHGNCSRCHHLHRGTIVKVRIRKGHISHVRCKYCGQKWIAFGGRNATSLSLISTETNDPSPLYTNFRSTLIEMVRSLVVVGSPTLASVPEQSPGGPSSEGHGMSNNEHHHHGSGVPRLFHDTSSPAIENVEPSAPKTTSTGPAPDASMSNTVDVQGPRGARSPSTRKFITHLKHKIRDLPFLRKFRLRGNARRRMEMRAKSDGKRPVPQPSVTNEYAVGREVDESKSIEASPPESKHNKSSGSDQDKDAKDRGVAEAMKLFERDKDRLTQMNEEEREVWIRDQITYFTDFRTWRAEVSIDRNHGRRSHDVFGSGHGFDDMSVVTHHPSVISLESVRLSQATTVGSLTATSGVRHYMLDTIMHPDRPRSRSPRPLSHPGPIARLRHEYELPHDAADRRSSMDSAASIRAVRNMPVVNGHSLPSLVSTGITVSPDAPTSQLQSLPSAQEDVHIDHIEGPPPSELTHEATPYINGHQTSEEASGNISSGVDHSSTMQSSGAS